jgi:hypothetical protein
MGALFILEIQVQINKKTEIIFLFCLCWIWIQIRRVLTIKNYLLIYLHNAKKSWIPLGMLSQTLILKMYVERDHLKMYWFNLTCLIKTGIQPSLLRINLVFLLLSDNWFLCWHNYKVITFWNHCQLIGEAFSASIYNLYSAVTDVKNLVIRSLIDTFLLFSSWGFVEFYMTRKPFI